MFGTKFWFLDLNFFITLLLLLLLLLFFLFSHHPRTPHFISFFFLFFPHHPRTPFYFSPTSPPCKTTWTESTCPDSSRPSRRSWRSWRSQSSDESQIGQIPGLAVHNGSQIGQDLKRDLLLLKNGFKNDQPVPIKTMTVKSRTTSRYRSKQ